MSAPLALVQSISRSTAEGAIELPGGIGLADPVYLLAIPLALLAAWYARASASSAPLRVPRVPGSARGRAPAFPRTVALRLAWLPNALRVAAIALVAVALARPLLGRVEVSSSTEGIDIALLVDRSTSMQQRDVPGGKRRIDIVREVVADYARRRTTDREGAADELALFAFAGYTDLLVPFTRDSAALVSVIEEIEIVTHREFDGTGIGIAVAQATEVLRNSRAKSKVIVLLTDGEETAHIIEPREATELAASSKVRVHVIYAGPKHRNPTFAGFPREVVDLRDLEHMAEATGGRFFHAEDRPALEAAYAAIEALERTPREESRFAERFDLYPRFLLAAVACYAAAWLLGSLWLRRLP